MGREGSVVKQLPHCQKFLSLLAAPMDNVQVPRLLPQNHLMTKDTDYIGVCLGQGVEVSQTLSETRIALEGTTQGYHGDVHFMNSTLLGNVQTL